MNEITLYQGALTGEEIDAMKSKGNSDNLFDNGYFAGGSISTGMLPVNQRGITSLQNPSVDPLPIFDRWKISGCNITLAPDGLTIANSNDSGYGLMQYVDDVTWNALAGLRLNLSFLVESATSSILVYSGSSLQTVISNMTLPCVVTVPVEALASASEENRFFAIKPYGTAKIKAVKLEVGDNSTYPSEGYYINSAVQTLAHQENVSGVVSWVVNDVPNYYSELAKCQRYYQVIKAGDANMTIATGCAYSAADIYASFNLQPMRAQPSITPSAQLICGTGSLGMTITSQIWFAFDPNSGFGTIRFITSGATVNSFYRIGIPSNQKIEFNAEL